YAVVSTTSSIEALNVFAEAPERFDLVITDMTMPDLTGDRLAQKIIAIRPDIPVILCTGHSDHVSAEDVSRLGIRQFLMKPYDLAQLSQALRQALDGAGNSKTQ
ncbi:MAG TPA: response regulator, partial [Smithellaceae bacterium]|nr:response regulator [Smithellaceae bacterium]